jgi:acetylornithine/succinyldiaminopimelate/putrescine aminotransferase
MITGTAGIDARSLQDRYELDVYGKRGITLVRGRGGACGTKRGREYIDCMSGTAP